MLTIREKDNIAIVQVGKKFHVVGVDRDRGQVVSVIPSDLPPDGGRWFAGMTDWGVRYVSSGHGWQYATRQFRRLMDEARDYREALEAAKGLTAADYAFFDSEVPDAPR